VKPIVLHRLAQKELHAAADYYERERAGLGRRFRLAFEAATTRFVHRLATYPIELGDARRCPVDGFPYNIIYLEESDAVWILAVVHHRRQPRYWAKRRPS
jgi:plasmid stabilization system protein ParE